MFCVVVVWGFLGGGVVFWWGVHFGGDRHGFLLGFSSGEREKGALSYSYSAQRCHVWALSSHKLG